MNFEMIDLYMLKGKDAQNYCEVTKANHKEIYSK
jgi:hypothetical protein